MLGAVPPRQSFFTKEEKKDPSEIFSPRNPNSLGINHLLKKLSEQRSKSVWASTCEKEEAGDNHVSGWLSHWFAFGKHFLKEKEKEQEKCAWMINCSYS